MPGSIVQSCLDAPLDEIDPNLHAEVNHIYADNWHSSVKRLGTFYFQSFTPDSALNGFKCNFDVFQFCVSR